MKNYLLITFIASVTFIGCTSTSTTVKEPESYTEIPWVDMGEVEALVKERPKKVFVDVYTVWCGPCKMLDRSTFKDSVLINTLGKNFYSVKFNAEGPDPITFKGKDYTNPGYKPERARTRNGKHQFTNTFGLRGYPSMIIMDENLNIIDKIVGYRTAEQLKNDLAKHLVASN